MITYGRPLLVAVGVLALALPIVLPAQQANPSITPSQSPDSAARLSYVDGSVSVLPPGAKQWDKAFLNRPLGSGDQLWSDRDSRAEVDLGGVLLRLSNNSEISMLEVSEQGLQLGVGVGTVDIALHDAESARTFEIDTPQVALALQRDGDYRINVDLDGSTTVLVRSGATHLTSRSGEGISLHDGQGAAFAADGTLDIADAHATDAFDRWCSERDAQWQHQRQAAQISSVPQDLPGAEQLSDAGQWSNQADYGQVWFPTQVVAGWAPYHDGRWAWVAPWGWMWLDRAAWGFAPFHYGRWVSFNGRWGWVPPSSQAPRRFAPAQIGVPAAITSAAPAMAPPTHVNAPPAAILSRPVVASHTPLSPSASVFPHVVVNTPPPRAPAAYIPVPSPVGPTIYARDVRPVTALQTMTATGNSSSRDNGGAASKELPPAHTSSAVPARPFTQSPATTRLARLPAPAIAPMPRAAPPPPSAAPVQNSTPPLPRAQAAVPRTTRPAATRAAN